MTMRPSSVSRAAILLLAVGGALVTPHRAPAVSAAAQTRPNPPRLVVMLVIDQFRADYIQTYGHQWTQGLRRIIDRGAVFRRAAYQYAGSITCPGHSTIGTGTLPFVHGMIGNSWYDRSSRRTMLRTTRKTRGLWRRMRSSKSCTSPARTRSTMASSARGTPGCSCARVSEFVTLHLQ